MPDLDEEFENALGREFEGGEAPPPRRGRALVFDPIDIVAGEEDPEVAMPHMADYVKPPSDIDLNDPETREIMERVEDTNRVREAYREFIGPRGSTGDSRADEMRGVVDYFAQVGLELNEHPEAMIGAAQGYTSDFADELIGLEAQANALGATTSRGGAGARSRVFSREGVEEADQAREDVTGSIREADARARDQAPALYGTSHAVGGLAQGMSVGNVPTQGLPWYARLGVAGGEAAAFGAATGAGQADDQEGMLEGAAEGAVSGLPYGLIGFGGAQLGDMVARAPGATRGAAQDLARHADRSRLTATGITGAPVLRQLDETYGGAGVGRYNFAEELRNRHIGERMGLPMPGPALDDAFELRASMGPEIGNPLAGPGSRGRIEREIDDAGGYVDLSAVADDLSGAAAHEADDVGSATEAVEGLAQPMRERGPVRFSDAHRQRQQFQQREFPGVPEQYTERAATILNEHLTRAAEGADMVRADRSGARIDFVDLGNRIEQQLLAEGAPPEAARQIGDDLRDAGSLPLQRAARVREQLPLRETLRQRTEAASQRAAGAPPGRGTTTARRRPPMAVPVEDAPIERGTTPQRRRPQAAPPPEPSLELGEGDLVDEFADTGARPSLPEPTPQVQAPPQAGPPVDRGAGTAPRGMRRPDPSLQLDDADLQAGEVWNEDAMRFDPPAAPVGAVSPDGQYVPPPAPVWNDLMGEWVQDGQVVPGPPGAPRWNREAGRFDLPEVPSVALPPEPRLGRPYGAPRAPVPPEYITRAQRAIDEEMEAATRIPDGPRLADQWNEANRTYGIGADVIRHGRGASRGTSMEIGEGPAIRAALGGDPTALARLHGTRAMGGLLHDVGRGAYTRATEAGARGLSNISDRLTQLLGSNPERLGPYARELAEAAQRGTQAVSAWHYQRSMDDPAYREMLEENGLGIQDDTGANPEIYDILGAGLTTEDL